MADASTPPPGRTLLAAAAGGFGGAILGVVAATTLMGDGNDGNGQAAIEAAPDKEVAVAVVDE